MFILALKALNYIKFLFANLSAQVVRNITLPKYLQGNIYPYLIITGLRMPTPTFSNAKNL